VQRTFQAIDAVVLVRDSDDQHERRDGLNQARAASTIANRIVIGLAIPERETWVISGFNAENDDERDTLQAETQNLGANPCLRSHELTACKDDQAMRSPKRVLAALTKGDWNRQRRCWTMTDLAVLERRGQRNGLADYLKEVNERIVPLITS
jgi:hypothetical protein